MSDAILTKVQLVQLGRKLKPSLSRVPCQMFRWLRALLGACRLGRLAHWALARVALERT